MVLAGVVPNALVRVKESGHKRKDIYTLVWNLKSMQECHFHQQMQAYWFPLAIFQYKGVCVGGHPLAFFFHVTVYSQHTVYLETINSLTSHFLIQIYQTISQMYLGMLGSHLGQAGFAGSALSFIQAELLAFTCLTNISRSLRGSSWTDSSQTVSPMTNDPALSGKNWICYTIDVQLIWVRREYLMHPGSVRFTVIHISGLGKSMRSMAPLGNVLLCIQASQCRDW